MNKKTRDLKCLCIGGPLHGLIIEKSKVSEYGVYVEYKREGRKTFVIDDYFNPERHTYPMHILVFHEPLEVIAYNE